MRTLYDCYKNPSMAKRRAWAGCKNLCEAYNGFDLTITGFNCFMFTAQFKFCDDETGEVKTMRITKTANRII